MKKYFYTCLVLVILLSLSDQSEAKNLYYYRDVGTLGGDNSVANGINNQGNIVGSSTLSSSALHSNAFLWTKKDGMRDLGTIGGPPFYSHARSINDFNQVVGEASTTNGGHAFLWNKDDGMRDLGTLGGPNSLAHGINNLGQVVGSSGSQAFLWTNQDGMRDLGNLGEIGNCNALRINNVGQIVGGSKTTSGLEHACLWENNLIIKDLGTLGGRESKATGINDYGQVVGISDTDIFGGAHGHAFLWTSSDGIKDLGTIGGAWSTAVDINNMGYVVGTAITASLKERAMLWTASEGMKDLNDLVIDLPTGLTLGDAFDINDLGQIVGTARDIYNIPHAFVLTPVPLPGAVLLLGAGLGRLAIYRRRKMTEKN